MEFNHYFSYFLPYGKKLLDLDPILCYFYRTVKIANAAMKNIPLPQYGLIKNAKELGSVLRATRKQQQLTLERISGLTRISTRFLSELERGKETAELGKVLTALDRLGLEVIIQPRGYAAKRKQVNFNDR